MRENEICVMKKLTKILYICWVNELGEEYKIKNLSKNIFTRLCVVGKV